MKQRFALLAGLLLLPLVVLTWWLHLAAPGVAAPGVAAPGVAAPGVAAPGVAAPQDAAAPDAAAPDSAAPDSAAPDAAATMGRYLIQFRARASFPAGMPADPRQRRRQLVASLQQTAAASQAALLAELVAGKEAGLVAGFRTLWINNSLAVSADPSLVAAWLARPEVAAVAEDVARPYLAPPGRPLPVAGPVDEPPASWGIERVGAPLAWAGLGVDGGGRTIAIMDSGVDWLHPALLGNYRGNQGGGADHLANWFDPVAGSPEPFDPVGHGTHVAGTAVGQLGLGVAPGATWMAARIFDELGVGLDSNIHAAFQWLLAPAGDPDLAPDIVNGSWGAPGANEAFAEDVALLLQAGILPVFAAGNDGPDAGTLGAPASYPGPVAVAASDDNEAVAWFSSRGPSPFTARNKPTLAAPGTAILSALPGGAYGTMLGTSMASPHVAGAAALVWSARPELAAPDVVGVLTATAAHMGRPTPNADSGWGRLDAYAAVATAQEALGAGILRGLVTAGGQRQPALPLTLTTPAGIALPFNTDGSGLYRLPLLPGQYAISAAPFAYQPLTVVLTVSGGAETVRDLALVPLPAGEVAGTVRDTAGTPLAGATVRAGGTPRQAVSDAAGAYTLDLPAGIYTLTVATAGFRLAQAAASVPAGGTVTQDFALEAGPRLLFVDSGRWLYDSYAGSYQAALEDAGTGFDTWTIATPFAGVPAAADLEPYDIVVWSSPVDSPGLVGAAEAVDLYLQGGGNLLISGQDVAWLDGGGLDAFPWFDRELNATFAGERTPPYALQGVADSPFAGLALELNGPDSAGNQGNADAVAGRDPGQTQPLLTYQDGSAAALRGGGCQPFNLVFLGFGLEGVSGAANRAEVARRSLETLNAPPRPAGVAFDSPPLRELAPPGTRLTPTLSLRNLGEEITETFSLSLENPYWSAALLTETIRLGPCQAGSVSLSLEVPAELLPDQWQTMTVRVAAGGDGQVSATLPVAYKTPGHLLLVDDDRFYDREGDYRAALDGLGLAYDVWETGWQGLIRGSPPAALLQAYDFVLWYTGYDWFEPLTDEEAAALAGYLAGGGRLFLSSQDYLYYHWQDGLTRDYFGVARTWESVTPTLLYAPEGEWPLSYAPYQNFSDGLMPALALPGREIAFWTDAGLPGGVASSGAGWRAQFWALPWETLPPEARGPALDRILGWLGDLGPSTFRVGPENGPLEVRRSYTLSLQALDLGYPYQVAVTGTLPASLTLDVAGLPAGWHYERTARRLTWQGELQSGERRVLTFTASLAGAFPPGSPLAQEMAVRYQRLEGDGAGHSLPFSLGATTWVGAPDTSGSALFLEPASLRPGETVSLALRLEQAGTATLPLTATLFVPAPLAILTQTVAGPPGELFLEEGRLQWQGVLLPGQAVTASLQLKGRFPADAGTLPLMLALEDGLRPAQLRYALLELAPYREIVPLVRSGP